MKITTPIHYLAAMAILSVCAILLASCMSTSTITAYDAEGRITSVTQTKESISKVVTADLANKTVVQCTNGWGAEVKIGAQLESGMTPSVSMAAGKLNWFYGSFLEETQPSQIADIITAWHENLSITPAGITSGPDAQSSQGNTSNKTTDGAAHNGTYTNLQEDRTIATQKAIVAKLLTFDGSKKFADLDETYEQSLKDLQRILLEYERVGLTESKVCVKRVSVSNGVITDLLYCYCDDSGCHDTACPNCTPWEVPEMFQESAEN